MEAHTPTSSLFSEAPVAVYEVAFSPVRTAPPQGRKRPGPGAHIAWLLLARTLELFRQQHHNIIASLHKLSHFLRAQRLMGKHGQIVELLADHRSVFGFLLVQYELD